MNSTRRAAPPGGALRTVLPFFALAGALSPQAAPQIASTCENTPAWSPCELVLELSAKAAAAHPDPYATVDLRAEFRSPQMRTYALPAYWDGGGRMVLRFSPTEAGHWEYRLTSNVAEWDGLTGAFTAAASDAPGFLRVANVHHWATTAAKQPHLWMGASEMRFAWLDDADFRAVVDARVAQKFNHLRGLVLGEGAALGFRSPGNPDLAHFQRLDQRIAYINSKGLVADLVLAPSPAALLRLLPDPEARRRFLRFLVGRYAARNVTWQGLEEFESQSGARALLAEAGALIKQLDPYQHPRSTGARVTSAPLLDDGWMDFAGYGTADAAVGAIEHQLYQVPGVALELAREDAGAGKSGPNDVDAGELRHRLWTAAMNGQYPTYANTGGAARSVDSPGAKAMTVWFNLMAGTRHWDLEPYFDVDGGRALALPGVDYIVYIDKPGPVELTVEHHGYDVYWLDPADGSITGRRKWSGQHFTGEPPDRYHDWVLRLVREATIESMNRSYKFESREVPVQEIVIDPVKVPYEIEQPTGALIAGRAAHFSAKLKRTSRATRAMLWMWTAEVTADHQGYRVLGTLPQGDFALPANLAVGYPATALLRLYAINGYGTVYMVAKGYDFNQ
ncbi:MAG: DUF5060 domain-containing protein [Bryobacteraceae bacterium]